MSASASGPSASHTNAPGEDNCTSCHITYPVNSGTGSVQISGVAANYIPGQQMTLSVTTSQSDAVIYGFQLTAVDGTGQTVGTFTLPVQNPARMKSIGGIVSGKPRTYIEHTVDGLYTNGVFGYNTWTFVWTAPAQSVGKIDFYAAGNAANSDGSNFGDYIYTASASTLPSSTPVMIGGRVMDSGGRGLRNATVTLTDSVGVKRSVLTSSLGYYSFADVATGQNYTLAAFSKRFRFQSQSINPSGDLSNLDFTGIE